METTAEMGQDEEGVCRFNNIGHDPCFTPLVLHTLSCVPLLPDDIDLELRLARFEELIARRPLLLNSVLLRQNPHNVHEWHKRVKLYEGNPRQVRFRTFYFYFPSGITISSSSSEVFNGSQFYTTFCRSSTPTLRQCRLWIQLRQQGSLTLFGSPLLNSMRKMSSWMM